MHLVARKRDGGCDAGKTLLAECAALVEDVLRGVADRKPVNVDDAALDNLAAMDAVRGELERFAVLAQKDVVLRHAGCFREAGVGA